jgi:DNA-binding transcriptional ArsR family regulator
MTTLVLVSRPEQTALTEAERTRGELAGAGMRRQVLALNGVFEANGSSDHDVCQRGLIAVFGVHQSLFAYHMKKLIAVGLVRVERRRKWAYYSVCTDAVQELSAFTAAEGSLRAPTCARPHGVTMPPGGIATKEG